MEYTTVENPVWANQHQTQIDCMVNFVKLGKVPFTADPNDLPHSAEIFRRCVAGEFGPIGEYSFDPFANMVEGPTTDAQIPLSVPGDIL